MDFWIFCLHRRWFNSYTTGAGGYLNFDFNNQGQMTKQKNKSYTDFRTMVRFFMLSIILPELFQKE